MCAKIVCDVAQYSLCQVFFFCSLSNFQSDACSIFSTQYLLDVVYGRHLYRGYHIFSGVAEAILNCEILGAFGPTFAPRFRSPSAP